VPNGEYIESDKFSVTAHGMDLEWQLCLYPSGENHYFEIRALLPVPVPHFQVIFFYFGEE
jgi:hypothetical protein